jgi:hypothetical protein
MSVESNTLTINPGDAFKQAFIGRLRTLIWKGSMKKS